MGGQLSPAATYAAIILEPAPLSGKQKSARLPPDAQLKLGECLMRGRQAPQPRRLAAPFTPGYGGKIVRIPENFKRKMRIPEQTESFLALTGHQRLFVSLWYSLTHPESLDSYRVPLHNGRTSLKELARTLKLGIAKPPSLNKLISECLEKVNNDPALPHLLDFQFQLLGHELQDAQKSSKGFNQNKLRFLFEDILSPSLDDSYQSKLRDSLRDAVNDYQTSEEDLIRLTIAFATDLVDRSWQIETLHSWVANLLKDAQERPFNERLDFMFRILTAPRQPFDVCLKVVGGVSLLDLENFGSFKFSAQVPIEHKSSNKLGAFQKPGKRIVFASSTIEAVDFKSAAHAALEKFEHCLDRIRFNFEQETIFPTKEILVVRSDQKFRFEKIDFQVPNPVFKLTRSRFVEFNRRFDELLENPKMQSETTERLQAAIRHYRLGQDAESYRDKFLSWWFGLEYLLKGSGGDIGNTIVKHGSHLLMQRYTFWILHDIFQSLRNEIKEVKAELWQGHESAPDKFSPHAFLGSLQDEDFSTALIAKLKNRPLLAKRLRELQATVNDPKKMLQFLEAHFKKISWQLDRFWGIRNSLVHGNQLSVRLLIPVSNMEFYLRECIVVTLRCFDRHKHVSNLNDLFRRAEISWETTKRILNDTNSGKNVIRHVVFDGLVADPVNDSHT